MKAAYEIWDTPSGDLLAYFERYGQALDLLHQQVEGLGPDWIQGIALLELKSAGGLELVAQDRDLLPLIRVPAETSSPSSR